KGEGEWEAPVSSAADDDPAERDDDAGPDLAVVRGLASGRRALEVAAAGGHHLLMVGRPGAGKTLLARCLPSILPPLDPEEALEVTRIHSAAGRSIGGRLVVARPFRAPHHTASAPALVGGGSGRPRPGEVTLAHRGILFMDESRVRVEPQTRDLKEPPAWHRGDHVVLPSTSGSAETDQRKYPPRYRSETGGPTPA